MGFTDTALTLAEMGTEVRRLLAETSAASHDIINEDVYESLEEGLKDACVKGKVNVVETTQVIVVSPGPTTAPDDCIEIVGFRDAASKPLDRVSVYDQDKLFLLSATTTSYWFTYSDSAGIDNELISFIAYPSGTPTYTIIYAKMAPMFTRPWTTTEYPQIPTQYHYGLVYYGVYRCLLKLGDYANAMVMYGKYLNRLGLSPVEEQLAQPPQPQQ